MNMMKSAETQLRGVLTHITPCVRPSVKTRLPFSRRQTFRVCVLSYAGMTLTLTP